MHYLGGVVPPFRTWDSNPGPPPPFPCIHVTRYRRYRGRSFRSRLRRQWKTTSRWLGQENLSVQLPTEQTKHMEGRTCFCWFMKTMIEQRVLLDGNDYYCDYFNDCGADAFDDKLLFKINHSKTHQIPGKSDQQIKHTHNTSFFHSSKWPKLITQTEVTNNPKLRSLKTPTKGHLEEPGRKTPFWPPSSIANTRPGLHQAWGRFWGTGFQLSPEVKAIPLGDCFSEVW